MLLALSITAAACLLSAASALAAGSISGTATAAGTGAPIAGLSVCATEFGLGSRCTATEAAGHYTIDGLSAGSKYQVEFSTLPFSDLNFLTQYFQGKEGLNNFDPVTVNDGTTTAGIDAVMNPGAQIAGHISEKGTEAPAEGVLVCVLDPAPNPRAQEFERCAKTGDDGNYVVRGLLAGTYIVVFSRYIPPFDSEPFAQQFYADATTATTATPITVAPPETRSGIDAILVNRWRIKLRPENGFHTVTRGRGVMLGFRFSAQVPVAGFACKRDRRPWRPCRSPHRFFAPLGRHAFRVRAIGPAGEGPVALRRFRVTRRPR